ncbi:hypothetical protein LMG28138_01918 [Pararobbsia alpina]|uniref:Uncharacterized protein n=1 Tax=Pararobbsia alpina TaxID=621374 RepID=A0A6S7BCD0_9BURK|nr:hypothetical protein LMG28138_01918 [Pararobbsia alpina]
MRRGTEETEAGQKPNARSTALGFIEKMHAHALAGGHPVTNSVRKLPLLAGMSPRVSQPRMREPGRIAVVGRLGQRVGDDKHKGRKKNDERPHPVRNQIEHDAPTSAFILTSLISARNPSGLIAGRPRARLKDAAGVIGYRYEWRPNAGCRYRNDAGIQVRWRAVSREIAFARSARVDRTND